MKADRVKQFFRDWGLACLLLMVGLLMLGVFLEIRRVGKHQDIIARQEESVLAAKQRIEGDRQAIAATRQKVFAIESRLQSNNVPDRLERIEKSIGSAVVQNKQAIEQLDARQKAITDKLQTVLGIPREEIVAPGEPETPRP